MSGPTFDDFLRRVHSDCVNASETPAMELSNDALAWRLTAKAEAAVLDSVLDAARRLAPYLNRYCDLGWPGLSERDRDEANNARVDLLNAARAQ